MTRTLRHRAPESASHRYSWDGTNTNGTPGGGATRLTATSAETSYVSSRTLTTWRSSAVNGEGWRSGTTDSYVST